MFNLKILKKKKATHSTATGNKAESAVAKYLKKKGYIVVDRNWKTQYCEIDIIAEADKAIYFVEVKYRKNADHGQGFDYITPVKLKQMEFAAQYWVSSNSWQGDYCLAAAEVCGENFEVSNFVEI